MYRVSSITLPAAEKISPLGVSFSKPVISVMSADQCTDAPASVFWNSINAFDFQGHVILDDVCNAQRYTHDWLRSTPILRDHYRL